MQTTTTRRQVLKIFQIQKRYNQVAASKPETIASISSPIFAPRNDMTAEERAAFGKQQAQFVAKRKRMGMLLMAFGASLMSIAAYLYAQAGAAVPVQQPHQMVAQAQQERNKSESEAMNKLRQEAQRLQVKAQQDEITRSKYTPKQ